MVAGSHSRDNKQVRNNNLKIPLAMTFRWLGKERSKITTKVRQIWPHLGRSYRERGSDPSDWSISIAEETRGSQVSFQVLINLAEEIRQY